MSNQFAPYQQQPPQFPQDQRQSGNGCLWGMAIGCLGSLVLMVLLCAGGLWYANRNAGKWLAGLMREGIVAVVNESEIPAGEKAEVIAQIDRVVNAYKSGQINEQDVQRLTDELQKSPAFLLMMTWGLEKAYVEPSGLSEDEKTAARRTVERAFRGLVEQKITQEQFGQVVPQQQGNVEANVEVVNGKPVVTNAKGPRQTLTDEQVRKMLVDLKKLADDASIPDEPFAIDIGDEVKKAVDLGLERGAAP